MFDFSMDRPGTLDELWSSIEAAGDGYRIIAGGTDLVVLARMGRDLGETWIDVTSIPDLSALEERQDHLWIGAAVTWQRLYRSPLTRRHLPAMLPCAVRFGSPQIRNLGTLGGNVAHASPAGDSIPVFMIHDTRVVLATRAGRRTLPIEQFVTGVQKNALEPGEVILGFEVPLVEEHAGCFLKLGPRASLAISKVSLAARARKLDGKLVDVRLALGAVAPTPVRAREAEKQLEGSWPDEALLQAAGEAAQQHSTPITDWRSTREYRHAMVAVLTRRAVRQLMDELDARS